MKTDIQIAQEAVMEPISKVAASIGIPEEDLEQMSIQILSSFFDILYEKMFMSTVTLQVM